MALPILSHFYRRRANENPDAERAVPRAKYLEAGAGQTRPFAAGEARSEGIGPGRLVIEERGSTKTLSAVPDATIDEATSPEASSVPASVADPSSSEGVAESFEAYSSGTFRTVPA